MPRQGLSSRTPEEGVHMAINHKFSHTKATSILELLQSNTCFFVPRFQRNYSWDVEKAEALWCDMFENYQLLKSENEQEAQYLLGPVVLVANSDPNSFNVIDGQQRLATITMLFCVARDIILEDLESEPKPDGFDKITELIENKRMGKHSGWKLELNRTDKEFFQEIQEFENGVEKQLDRIKNVKPKPPSLKRLRENYMRLHKLITDALYTDFEPDKKPDIQGKDEKTLREIRVENHPKLLHFLTHVRENNYLIQVMVSDDSSAFQIFETLNERGEVLSKSNLIKNHILNKVNDDKIIIEQSDKWDKIFDEIVVKNKQSDDDFILESYKSRYGDETSLRSMNNGAEKISKKTMYKIIKKMVRNQDACKRFIKELDVDAVFLSALYDPDDYSYGECTKDEIYVIKALKAKFIRVPLLAAYRKWYDNGNTRDYSSLVKYLVKFFFKMRTVSEVHPGEIEDMMHKVTGMINRDKSFDEVLQQIKEYDNHDNFKHDFKRRFMPKPSRDAAKYVLQQITIRMGTKYQDVRPIRDLTLEHVLPVKHEKSWHRDAFLDNGNDTDDLDDYVDRLGNMTLLKSAINSKTTNSTFVVKRDSMDKDGHYDGYRSSQLEINKKTVVEEPEWTASTIEKRENKFADLADKIWDLNSQ